MTSIDFQKLAADVHENAKAKGFWGGGRNMGELFMLIISELGEALEAHRKGKFADWDRFSKEQGGHAFEPENERWQTRFKLSIKDTFEDEIADVVIRILDYSAHEKIYLDPHEYEQQGDFQLDAPNVGETLMEINGWLCRAYDSAKTLAFVETEGEKQILALKINAAVILLFNLSEQCGFNIYRHIEAKMKFNSMRERLHGKAY